MDARGLRYFIAVFNHQSLTRAAESLYMSQPALSRSIRELEKECGVSLFERTVSGAVPTAAAYALLPHAKAAVRMIDDAAAVARDGATSVELVEVGLAPGLDPDWLESIYDSVESSVAGVELAFCDLSSAEQVRHVRQGRLDLGLIHEPSPFGLTSRQVFQDQLGIALPPDSPLNAHTQVGFSDLDGLRVLAHSRDQVSTVHDMLLTAARDHSVTPHWRFSPFLENASIAARATRAQAALMTASSAMRLVPDWTWRELRDPILPINTYLVHALETRQIVTKVSAAILAAAGTEATKN